MAHKSYHSPPTLGSCGYRGLRALLLKISSLLQARRLHFGIRSAVAPHALLPNVLTSSSDQVTGAPIHYTYGLHKRCSSLTHTCEPYPQYEDCHGDNRHFCSMWRTVGFLMSFAVVLEGMTLIAYLVILAGGKQKRESGWKILSTLLLLAGLVQCAGMALIVSRKPFQPAWFAFLAVRRVLILPECFRLMFTITMTGSSRLGNWILPGRCALVAGAS